MANWNTVNWGQIGSVATYMQVLGNQLYSFQFTQGYLMIESTTSCFYSIELSAGSISFLILLDWGLHGRAHVWVLRFFDSRFSWLEISRRIMWLFFNIDRSQNSGSDQGECSNESAFKLKGVKNGSQRTPHGLIKDSASVRMCILPVELIKSTVLLVCFFDWQAAYTIPWLVGYFVLGLLRPET